MLASRCVSFYETILKQVLSFALDFFLIYAKMTLTAQFLAEIYNNIINPYNNIISPRGGFMHNIETFAE